MLAYLQEKIKEEAAKRGYVKVGGPPPPPGAPPQPGMVPSSGQEPSPGTSTVAAATKEGGEEIKEEEKKAEPEKTEGGVPKLSLTDEDIKPDDADLGDFLSEFRFYSNVLNVSTRREL